jgi:hypothetical protein
MLGSLRRLMVAGAAVLAAGATAVPAQAATLTPGGAGPAVAAPAGHKLIKPAGRSTAHINPQVGARAAQSGSATSVNRDPRAALTIGVGNLTYNGGFVQTAPKVYLDFWGSQWTSGTDASGFPLVQGETYVNTFVNDIAGSQYLGSQTQYCQHPLVATGSDISSCPGTTFAGLPGPVAGVVPPGATAAPKPTVEQDIVIEADRARGALHLPGGDQNTLIVVLSPSGASAFSLSDLTGSFCGFHDWIQFSDGTLDTPFAYIPWSPDATPTGACHENEVNKTDDTFGHGHLDGMSITTGHEIAEAITDPLPGAAIQTQTGTAPFFGWVDIPGNAETGDKCDRLTAWPERNLTFGGDFFPVQPLWTDAATNCALESVGGLSTNQPAIATQDSVHRDVFVRSGDGAVWTRSSAGGAWGSWTSLGGLTPNGPAAVSWGPGRIDIFVRGMDNGLWHRGWTPAGWSPWLPLGGIITSAPTVASWAANRLDVFARGQDNALWHIAWTGTVWTPWQTLGGAVTADPGAVSWAANRIDVFIRSTDNGMWHIGWNGTSWSGWESHGGGFLTGFTASSTAANQVSAYAVGLDHQIYRLSWNGSAWVGWQGLGGFLTVAPAAVAPPGGTLPVELFTTGSNGTTERLVLGI